ncbi:MAG: type II toxin-antitoxin system RelE/ParE family toxin [bacterium]|nr:type II toxin-antitoxin system RelE/ParE family toxin [bacterium]
MLFRIEITRSAENDIDDAYLWIYERNPTYAERWIRGLMRAVHSLKELPARCPIAAENQDLDREIRRQPAVTSRSLR